MKIAKEILTHLTVVLALMFLVFLILDEYNPLMNFVDNALSRALLGALCASVIGRAALDWAR